MSVCDVPVISSVCDAVGSGVASLVSAPFDWLAQALAGAAAWMFEAVWSVMDATTLVDVTRPEYVSVYNVLFGVAVFIMLIFFCLQLITGLTRRDPGALSRAALGLAKSILGSFLVITLTGLLLEITDQLSVGIVQATGHTMSGMGDQIGLLAAGLATINLTAPGVGAILTIFLAGLAVSAAAIVWFSLLIRKALLLVAIVFGPVALAGVTWDATKGWVGKWASFVIALIVSKLVLVVIFLVAVSQVAGPIEADLSSIGDAIAGVVLMFIAAFAPYIAYKFINFVGFDMYHAMSAEQEAKQSLNRPIPIPSTPGGNGSPKQVLDGGDGGGGAGSGGGNGGPPPPPPPPAAAPAAETGAAGAGAGAGAGGAGAGAGAAGGPAGLAVVAGAAVVKGAATAGPKAGNALGAAADAQAGAAGENTTPPPSPAVPPPTTPPTPPMPPAGGAGPRHAAPPPEPAPPSAPPVSGKE